MINAIVIQNLVGTLTTTGSSGKPEPYFAESWISDSKGKEWVFKLRPNLSCDDGTVIDANSFVSNLERQFKSYAKIGGTGSLGSFDELVGVKEFLEGSSPKIRGLLVGANNTITLLMNKKPDNLIEDLGTPYFGFWCPGNFTNGAFSSKGKFISSGSYSLKHIDAASVELAARPDWFRLSERMPKSIQIRPLGQTNHIGSKELTIVQTGIELPKFDDITDYTTVKGWPVMLTALRISPYAASKMFREAPARRLLRQKIETSDILAKLPKDGIEGSNSFFANAPATKVPFSAETNFPTTIKNLKVCLSHSFSEQVMDTVKSTISGIFNYKGAPKIDFEFVDRSKPDWNKMINDGKVYDIQVANVVIGGYFLNSQIQFMFCSNLGVTFWDVSGRICKQAREYADARPIDQNYVRNFNRALQEDSTVIPLFHSGIVYVYSKDIDPKSISTESANYPPFDTLRILN